MHLLFDPVTLVNLILCILIVIMSIIGCLKIRSATPLYIGAAFFLFGVSHAATLLGLKTALETEMIIVRALGYITVCIGVYLIIREIILRMKTEEELETERLGLERRVDERTAELQQANEAITRIAAIDDLTGLANRRCFYESLEKAVSLARRHGSPLALVSLDLDGLKRVNDSAGHEAGDEVLTNFAALLGALCRVEDLPGRLGGDEFSLLLPGIDLSGARGFAERVLTAARSCEALEQRGVTVSGGGAQWTPDELPDDLLRRADEALYAAKHSGGDAVAVDA